MDTDKRHKNANWNIYDSVEPYMPGAQLAVLMDIRDELQALNRLLSCSNCTAIPHILRDISKNTKRQRKRKAVTPARKKKGEK